MTPKTNGMDSGTAIKLVLDELHRATNKFGSFASCHEGYAVIKEELDELWEEIKNNQGDGHRGASEAVQLAAMSLRYLIDLCPPAAAEQHEGKVETWSRSETTYGYSG